MNECPVLTIRGIPPLAMMASSSAMLHLTSKKTVRSASVPPRRSTRTSAAMSAISRSGWMKRPRSSTIPMRSPSPSIPIPNSQPFSITAAARSSIFFWRVGSGGWLGNVLSQSQWMGTRSTPNRCIRRTVSGPGTAFPQSMAIRIVRRGLPAFSTMVSTTSPSKSGN